MAQAPNGGAASPTPEHLYLSLTPEELSSNLDSPDRSEIREYCVTKGGYSPDDDRLLNNESTETRALNPPSQVTSKSQSAKPIPVSQRASFPSFRSIQSLFSRDKESSHSPMAGSEFKGEKEHLSAVVATQTMSAQRLRTDSPEDVDSIVGISRSNLCNGGKARSVSMQASQKAEDSVSTVLEMARHLHPIRMHRFQSKVSCHLAAVPRGLRQTFRRQSMNPTKKKS